MRKALLLFNPLSGRRVWRRFADVEAAAEVLRKGGIEASTTPTRAAGEAAQQVKQAVAEGFDTIFACGGDGTVHDVLQGLIGTHAALGIIPLGTANSLAHDLGFPASPLRTARAALTATPRRVTVGRLEYRDFAGNTCNRYFALAVGIGVDAHLFYNLNPLTKRHLGMMAYYSRATRLWLTHKMQNFAVEFSNGSGPRNAEVSQVLAVRIQDFGGILRELAPGASIHRDDLRLVLFHTRSRAAYLGYIIRGLLGQRWKVPGIELIHSSELACQPLAATANPSRIFVEADGELLGTLPVQIGVVPDAVNLLVPSEKRHSERN